MEDREVEVETYEELPLATRKYSESDDPYTMPAAEERKGPAKYSSARGASGSDEVKVSVSDPIIKEETLTKHVVYTVKVSSK
jgi:hypothetical protein